MTTTLLPPTETATEPAFADGEGLRALLVRLHRAGPGAWRHDSEAAALMTFAANRYAGLARKYGHEPADAAVAAVEAMRNGATHTAGDPRAVVTVAVKITLIAEHRANGMLTTTRLLLLLGWLPATTWTAVEYVCARLADIGDRHGAYESLRRDKALRARLDVPHERWIGLLRITLGHPTATGVLRHGTLARLLAGDTLTDLLDDDQLVAAAVNARPGRAGEQRG